MDAINIFSIITIAFLGSFGHCVGMCGGIVIAYTSTKIGQDTSKIKAFIAHLLYSFGRISTYMLLGAIFGFLGGVATFSNMANGILLMVAGAFMVLAGLSLGGKMKFLSLIEHSVSQKSWYKNSFKSLLASQTLTSFYLLGILNGLLPCGFVYFFAITAASTGDAFWGAIVMAVFGLSTIPSLLGLGMFVGLFSQSRFRDLMIKLASVTVIIYALFTMYNGMTYIQNPNKTLLECH